jgi:hypothetical protein
MMAHNLCYTTLLNNETAARLPPESYEKSPCGDMFVKATVQKGILPEILQELLTARKRWGPCPGVRVQGVRVQVLWVNLREGKLLMHTCTLYSWVLGGKGFGKVRDT